MDNGSNEVTYEVLQTLRESGFPLVLLPHPTVGYEQAKYITELMYMAVHQFGADWVAPLDADEFVLRSNGCDFRLPHGFLSGQRRERHGNKYR